MKRKKGPMCRQLKIMCVPIVDDEGHGSKPVGGTSAKVG
jgi:hypothetical protein